MDKLAAMFLGTVVGVVTLFVAGDRLRYRPPPPPSRFDALFTKEIVEENHKIRAENFQLKCQVLDLATAVLTDRVGRDADRRAVTPGEAGKLPGDDPADLIPPQNVPLVPRR